MEIKANILVVDDNEELSDGIKEFLEHEEYAVECANCGKDAIALVQDNKYDVALVDIEMPDMSGSELVKKLSSISSSMEFIHITAYASLDSAIDAVKQNNVISYETKPIDMERLLSLLGQITKRRRAEEELEEGEVRYKDIFENVNDLIQCITPEGRVVYVNNAWKETLGYNEEDIARLILFDIVHPDSHAHCMDMFKRVTSGEKVKSIEVIFITKDGRKIVVEGSVNCRFNAEGKPVSTRGIFRDITDRKKMEEALLQSEKLKSIGTITAGISHEFNNILAIISGNVQLMEKTYKDHVELIDTLRTIKKATNDGAEISSKMLRFTKSSQDTTELVSCDIRDLIKQSIDFTMPRWKNMAQANGISYHMDSKDIREVPEVYGNQTEYREIFINIINNALDAMPDGGRIIFSTWNKDGAVFISISDTGKGMTEDVKKKIFDPFFTTRRPEGTGLGLSITYGIIIRHGGEIAVESKVGEGSTFTLQFPIATGACSTKEISVPEQETKRDGLKILVIDDESEICDILEKLLSSDGHMVKAVNNGAEAIILAKNSSYDLVLCDMVMPEVFGYDVIKALNELERRPKIGIITGWGDKLKPIEDMALKVDFIIKKPFSFSEIVKHINNTFK